MNDDLEVVWNGTLDREGTAPSLVAERTTKVVGLWVGPKRIYNKKADFWQTRIPIAKKQSTEEKTPEPETQIDYLLED